MSLTDLFRFTVRAGRIQKSLGTRCAAGYLRNRGMGLDHALIALGFPVRAFTSEGKLL